MAAASDSIWAPTWPLSDDAQIQLSPDNVWQQGGEAWARYEVYKDAVSVESARAKGATDKDLKKLFRKGAMGVLSPQGKWILCGDEAKDVKGELAQRMERSPLSDMDGLPAKAARPEITPLRLEPALAALQGPTNADIMARLGTMMDTMVIKEDLNALKRDITQETKVSIAESVDPIKNEIADLKNDLASMEGRLTKIEQSPQHGDERPGAPGSESTIHKKIEDIQKTIAQISAGETPRNGLTIVTGGFKNATDVKEVETWLSAQLVTKGAIAPILVYSKVLEDEAFKGIAFAKFANATAMDSALTIMSSGTMKYKGEEIWAKQEKPFSTRVAVRFLLGLKKLLIKWKFNKKAVVFDDETLILKVEDDPKLTVNTIGDKIELEWSSQEWAQWKGLHDDEEYKQLLASCTQALAESIQKKKKGTGKGKAGGRQE